MKHILSVSVGVFALLLAVMVLSPQLQAQTGSISGTVTDSSGAVVQGAEITARNLGTNETHATKSGANGAYTMTNLPVGDYEVNAKQGVADAAVSGLLNGENASLHQTMISMEEASVSFQLMVEVRNRLLESYQEIMRMQL